jgi:hypothetical protein
MIDPNGIIAQLIKSLEAKQQKTKPAPAGKAASRRKAEEAVKTYKDLTSGRGFSGLSPAQIAKKLAAREELIKPEPIVFRPPYILERFPESAGRFFDALDLLYTLPKEIQRGSVTNKTSANPTDWVNLTGSVFDSVLLSNPNIRLQPKQGLPGIEIQMIPIDNETGQKIFNEDDYRPAPIYVKDVQPWKESQDIQNHPIKGWAGAASENQELFSQPETLKEFIAGSKGSKKDLGITDETTVVHLNTVLPIDSQDTFTAEFLPKILHPRLFQGSNNFDSSTGYKLTVIEGDRISNYQQLMDNEFGSKVYRTVPDENNSSQTNHYNWKPNYVPDMGELQKELINGSKSRMIIIATPYTRSQGGSNNFYSNDYGSVFKSNPFTSSSLGEVRFSQGSSAGGGRIIDDELESASASPVIFVIDYLGVKPEDAAKLKRILN